MIIHSEFIVCFYNILSICGETLLSIIKQKILTFVADDFSTYSVCTEILFYNLSNSHMASSSPFISVCFSE